MDAEKKLQASGEEKMQQAADAIVHIQAQGKLWRDQIHEDKSMFMELIASQSEQARAQDLTRAQRREAYLRNLQEAASRGDMEEVEAIRALLTGMKSEAD